MSASLIYNVALAILWIIAIAAGFGLWKLAVVLRNRKRRERWAAWVLAGALAVMLLVDYSLMYPAALRCLSRTSYSGLLDLFVPAEWIYDETPLRGPILKAGEFWGIAAQLERDSQSRLRSSSWGANPRLNAVLCVAAVAAVASGVAVGVRKTLNRFRTKTRSQPEASNASHPSHSSTVRGQSDLSRRESDRSASRRPPV